MSEQAPAIPVEDDLPEQMKVRREKRERLLHQQKLTAYEFAKLKHDRQMKLFNKEGTLPSSPIPPVKPTEPRLKVVDTTYQKLGEIAAANPRGVLVFGDEMSGLLHSLDAKGQEGARAFYLSGWGGKGDTSFDRIGRGSR